MRIGFLQLRPRPLAVAENLDRIAALLAGVAADLVVLPELCTTGYQLTAAEVARLAEPVPGGPTAERLAELARRERLHLVAGVAERGADGQCYNSAVLVGPEGVRGTYRKTHLFADERAIFAPGHTGFVVHPVGDFRVGMMICFDWLFPESARCLALAGADVLAHPANLVLPWCQRSMPVRCLENGVFAVTANRVGAEDRLPGRPPLAFTGGSVIVDPSGEVLAAASVDREEVRVVAVEVARARDKRIGPANDRLADRRPECYAGLAQPGDRQYERDGIAPSGRTDAPG